MGNPRFTPKTLFLIFAAAVMLAVFCLDECGAEDASEQETSKIRKIADFIAADLARRNIKSVTVDDFTDARKRVTQQGRSVAHELQNSLAVSGASYFSVVKVKGQALVKGVIIPFRGKKRTQLRVTVYRTADDSVMTTFGAILSDDDLR